MSDKTDKDMRDEKLINWTKLEVVIGVIVGLIAIGGALGSLYVLPGRVDDLKSDVRDVQTCVSKLTTDAAVVHGNRFTSSDWLNAKMSIDAQMLQLDKRTTRNEDAITAIKQSLDRIEAKIDRIENTKKTP